MEKKSDSEIKSGSVINGYEFMSVIGKGGSASCYKVRSIKFDLIFCAKMIRVRDGDDQSAWSKFDIEVQSLSNLDHPHIIRLYDHFKVNNAYFIILEYCSGGSLIDEIARCGFLPEQRFYTVARQIVSAVKYAHSMNVTHRDIKPANVLLDEFGRVKLADFGISTFSSSASVAAASALADSVSGNIPIGYCSSSGQFGIINGSFSNLNGSLTNLKGSLTTFNGSLTNLNSSLSNFNSSLTNIKGGYSNFNGSSTNLNGSSTNLNGSCMNLCGSMNLNGSCMNLNGSCMNLNGSSTNLNGSCSNFNASCSNLINDNNNNNIPISKKNNKSTTNNNIPPNQSSSNAAFSNNNKCSLCYAPPELLKKQPHDDKLSDMWALGITLLQCWTGSLPYQCETREEVIKVVSSGIIAYPVDCPAELLRMFKALTAYAPSDRKILEECLYPASAKMMGTALSQTSSAFGSMNQIPRLVKVKTINMVQKNPSAASLLKLSPQLQLAKNPSQLQMMKISQLRRNNIVIPPRSFG